jgi:uncharacterized membrane protein
MDRPDELRAENSQTAFLVSGWLLAAFSVLIPFLAIGAGVFGVIAVQRGKPWHGAGMIAVSLLGVLLFFYLGSQTLVPR